MLRNFHFFLNGMDISAGSVHLGGTDQALWDPAGVTSRSGSGSFYKGEKKCLELSNMKLSEKWVHKNQL